MSPRPLRPWHPTRKSSCGAGHPARTGSRCRPPADRVTTGSAGARIGARSWPAIRGASGPVSALAGPAARAARRALAWYSGPCLRGSAYSFGLIVQYVPLVVPYQLAPTQSGSNGLAVGLVIRRGAERRLLGVAIRLGRPAGARCPCATRRSMMPGRVAGPGVGPGLRPVRLPSAPAGRRLGRHRPDAWRCFAPDRPPRPLSAGGARARPAARLVRPGVGPTAARTRPGWRGTEAAPPRRRHRGGWPWPAGGRPP